MTKRIFRSIIGAAAAVILCCTAIIIGVLFNHFNAVQRNQLAAQTELASHGVELNGAAFLKGLEIEGYRLTWIAADGVVLYDTEKDAASMENHLDREEVKEAQKYGIGESERMSDAIAEKMLYYAKRLNDGTVLRVSVAQSTVYAILFGMLQPILILFTVAVILAAVLARRLARHIVEPLDRLDLDNPLEIDAYEELSPLLTRIEHQHRLLSKQFTQLKRKQDEFSAVTDNMSEGLILLGEKGEILSINRTAERLFDTNGSCVGKDILTVDRSVRMQKLLKAAQDGIKSETHARLAGGDYQINANPVISEGKVVGICIIAFDITEKTRAEQIRREFSANVSHELKTPLHAIMGSAELIEAGLVKTEDMPRFVERIRIEGARLLTLIDDIIR